MNKRGVKWEILRKQKNLKTKSVRPSDGKTKSLNDEGIIKILLENRGLKTDKEKQKFFSPVEPENIPLKDVGLKKSDVNKAIKRLLKARKSGEKVIVFGDYDADGICATAILWEVLHGLGINALPYIPDRFEEGYGLSTKGVENVKLQNPKVKLIITVDNGIVAHEGVDVANKLGIDVIITDHHQIGKKSPDAHCIIHTTEVGGAGIAWFLGREIVKNFKDSRNRTSSKRGKQMSPKQSKFATGQANVRGSLELAAIGTIADQIPLLGVNRSLVKYGLKALNKTKRLGLLSLFKKSGIEKGEIDTYGVGFIIAPRINAMGRMEHAIDSLRLLCTTNLDKAEKLANLLNKTNFERQKVVEKVVLHAREKVGVISEPGLLVLAHDTYHEGVIGLAASKLVEEFYRPAIVLSKGETISKASARSISGFNIIEAIKKLDNLLEGGGGHPMAAGFSLSTEKIEVFKKEIERLSKPLLTDDILSRKLRIDMILGFEKITKTLVRKLKKFEPTGLGNPTPSFATEKVEILDARTVGRDKKHLKLKIMKEDRVFDAIAFGKGNMLKELLNKDKVDVAYRLEINNWNGRKSIQLKVKDLKL